MRDLFLTILLFCDVSNVKNFWEFNWEKISEDILRTRRLMLRLPTLVLSEEQINNLTLAEQQKILLKIGRSLEDIDGMPLPDKKLLQQLKNRMILEEQNYDIQLLKEEHETLKKSLNPEQLEIYHKVINVAENNTPQLYFLYGYGGTGKTYVYRAIISKLRSSAKIVLAVASSGIASLLLPGGRTAHSRFRIPLNVTEESTCTIKQGTQMAELIQKASLVIWDETPMDAKYAFEAVDKTLKDILRGSDSYNKEKAFSGKTFLLGGDFRQILPVVSGSTRSEIVNTTLNSSYLWKECEVCVLTRNMRLQQSENNINENSMSLKDFSDWILRVENGSEPAKVRGDSEEAEWIKIPNGLMVEQTGDAISDIFYSTYPDFDSKRLDIAYLTNRAILTPKNETVDKINKFILNRISGEETEYLSMDSIENSNSDMVNKELLYPVEFLNSLNLTGIPEHKFHLKIGVPVMLLRNINPSKGMCNGTRLIVTQLEKRVIEGCIISGSNIGDKVLIPRICLTSSEGKLPFLLKRRQFPVRFDMP